MGYELHLVKTKSGSWVDDENRFTEREWENYRKKNEPPEWLYFSSGNISVKNPNQTQIVDLVKIAKQNGWGVQGDDDKTYSEDGSPIPPEVEKPSFFEPIRKFFSEQKARRNIRHAQQNIKIPLKIGDKVKTQWRKGGVVISIDPEAEHGVGMVKVRWPDGTELGSLYVCHFFEKEE